MPRLALACLLVVLSGLADGAPCPLQPFTAPSALRLKGDTVLIVTHATSFHDPRQSTRHGVDEALRFARARGISVVHLQGDASSGQYFADDCEPGHRVYAPDGEVDFDVAATHVIVAGGHLELCLSRTLHDLIDRWSKGAQRARTITYLMDAIYSNGKLVGTEDPYHDDLQRFMNIVTYGRPGGESWPKVTLLETMGIIGGLSAGRDYLRRILPSWERALPAGGRVEMQLNMMPNEVLRRGDDARTPALLFRFVDSAAELAASPFAEH